MSSILLISAAFAPSQLIGGRRVERMATALRDAGWDVTVLTPHAGYSPPVDPSLCGPSGIEVLRTQAVMPRTWLRAAKARVAKAPAAAAASSARASTPPTAQQRVRTLARGVLQNALHPIEFPDEYRGWNGLAARAVRGRRFDVVLASLPAHSSALLAAEIATNCQARLVLDYRDPWSELQPPATAAAHRQLENQLLQRADCIFAVTPSICALLQPRTNRPIHLVTNGYLGPAVTQFAAPQGPPGRLVYAGSLAYGRDLTPLLQAMASLRPAIGPQTLRLTYAGPHGAGLLAQAAQLGVADAVDDVGELSNMAALALLQGSLAGVVVVSSGFDYAYPGKIFEILGQHRPLLAIAPAGCDTANLIARHRLGFSHPAEDAVGLGKTLSILLQYDALKPIDLESLSADRVMHQAVGHLTALLAGPSARA